MPLTRAEKRSLLTFYNAFPEDSVTQCRIGEAAAALMIGFEELEPGREGRALCLSGRLATPQGASLTRTATQPMLPIPTRECIRAGVRPGLQNLWGPS